MSYDIKAYRTVKHGIESSSAYCRQCKWSMHDNEGNVPQSARDHCKAHLHTVDIYRENHTEVTCHVNDNQPK